MVLYTSIRNEHWIFFNNWFTITLFWLSYYFKRIILVIHTHKITLALIWKCSSPKLLKPRQRWFLKVELEMKSDPSGLKIFHIPLFWLSYYYEIVILVIHTQKITLALIRKYSSPKLLRPRQEWFYILGWEMNTADGTRFALQWILDKVFKLFLLQFPDIERPRIVIYCH